MLVKSGVRRPPHGRPAGVFLKSTKKHVLNDIMCKIFISYRRSDTEDVAGRFYEHLANSIGQENIFKDVYSIPYGEDFRDCISNALKECKIFIILIGSKWVSVRNEKNELRLFDADDTVRVEIETALKQKIHILPILIGSTSIPKRDQLPVSLWLITYKNTAKLRPDPDFIMDMRRITLSIINKLSIRVSEKSIDSQIYQLMRDFETTSSRFPVENLMNSKIKGVSSMSTIYFFFVFSLFMLGAIKSIDTTNIIIIITLVFTLVLLGFFIITKELIKPIERKNITKEFKKIESNYKKTLRASSISIEEINSLQKQLKTINEKINNAE